MSVSDHSMQDSLEWILLLCGEGSWVIIFPIISQQRQSTRGKWLPQKIDMGESGVLGLWRGRKWDRYRMGVFLSYLLPFLTKGTLIGMSSVLAPPDLGNSITASKEGSWGMELEVLVLLRITAEIVRTPRMTKGFFTWALWVGLSNWCTCQQVLLCWEQKQLTLKIHSSISPALKFEKASLKRSVSHSGIVLFNPGGTSISWSVFLLSWLGLEWGCGWREEVLCL